MGDTRLKTAVLGLNEEGRVLLEAASQVDYFRIEAVADKDSQLAEKVAGECDCAAYDDYRQLITQNQFDCLLVAAGMYSCEEHLRAAVKKRFHIFKLAPPARNFEEAASFVRLADEEGVKFVVAAPRRFAQSYLAFRQFLKQSRDEQIFLISVVCNVGERAYPAWQTDPKLAGGGVLLRNCYDMIDQVMWNFPIPQQVYSLGTSMAGDRQQRLCLTEDVAVVTMKFTDTFFANLTASRTFGPEQEFFKLYSRDKILTVSDTLFGVGDRLGRVIEEARYSDDGVCRMAKMLSNFALGILEPGGNELCSSGRESLKNMAVIESAYLSTRTGMPEEPGRVLKMAQIEPANILPAPK